jgi:hypothetical protein
MIQIAFRREGPMETLEPVKTLIHEIRRQRVILDADLARIYGVSTRRLNEQVKRNAERFPEDFAFQLTEKEATDLRSQFATSRSHGGRRYLPHAFTEHGAIMAATVLNSKQAVTMSVYVVRAFVQMREELATNREILKRLAEIDRTLLQQDAGLRSIYRKLLPLLQRAPLPPKRRIGFSGEKGMT